jgi:hypothetical protein
VVSVVSSAVLAAYLVGIVYFTVLIARGLRVVSEEYGPLAGRDMATLSGLGIVVVVFWPALIVAVGLALVANRLRPE